MNDAEVIVILRDKALAIMREGPHPDGPNARADRLEVAYKYMICCAILSGELPYDQIQHLAINFDE